MTSQKKVFNGTVTKFIDNFGFVDDDVFFRIEVVEGGPVKIHDQVYVECEFSEQLPFKWNATKVKVLGPGRVAPTYLQHRMQQMLQHHSALQQTNNLNVAAQQIPQKTPQDQANFFTPELRKLIEKQQQQPQLQAFQPAIQNNPPPQQFARQNDFNQSPAFSGQITYTSTPGSAFVSPVMPFNQGMNVQQQQPQGLPLANMRMNYANNPTNNYPKRDNPNLNRKDRDDHRNIRDNRDRPGIVRKEDPRDRHRDNDKRDDRRDNRDRDNRESSRDIRESSRDSRDRKNTTGRDRRTVSPSGSVTSSTTSKPRRRYTPLNIPIHEILHSPINSYDIKRKFDASIHIPSDFKELQINDTFELNFQSLYKPIQYRIIHADEEVSDKKEGADKKSEDSKSKKETGGDSKKEASKENSVGDEAKDESNDKTSEKAADKPDEEKEEQNKPKEKSDSKESSSKSSSKKKSSTPLSDKYAVKVLLLSIPSLNNIYDRVIENDRDKDGHSSNKAYFLHFNKIFSYLCLKNHNDGHALIGGKFDAKLDGYMAENTPNLIQTAVRCVKQQTGIDLSSCKKWKHMCTFLYNRDESPFYDNVAFEYSNIFIPDVWSLLENPPACIWTGSSETNPNHKPVDNNKFVDKLTSPSQNNSIKSEQPDSDSLNHSLDNSNIDCANGGDSFNSLQVQPSDSIAELPSLDNSKADDSIVAASIQSADSAIASQISRLNELKVTDLRAELEKFGHKPAKNVKKADLVATLAQILKSQQKDDDVSKLEEEMVCDKNEEEALIKEEAPIKEEQPNDLSVTEEGEGKAENIVETEDDQTSEPTGKRKAEEQNSSEQPAKKVKQEESKEANGKLLEAVQDGEIVAYGSSSITVLNLYQALNHDKYDHFELQVASELLREALTSHFCGYILSACYENRHLLKESDDKKDDAPKDLPDNNYVLLAFSYFDSCHCGYLTADDLQKLLSCCGVNFSKRTWTYIFGSNDKIKYRYFKEPTKVYSFAGLERKVNKQLAGDKSGQEVKSSLYVKDGNVFDIDKLIAQSESDEKLKAELKDRLKLAEDTIHNLQASLSESNSRRDKAIAANKKQNEEICDYKRDKEKIKHKYDESLKLINSTLGQFNEFIKKHEDKVEKVKEKDGQSNDH